MRSYVKFVFRNEIRSVPELGVSQFRIERKHHYIGVDARIDRFYSVFFEFFSQSAGSQTEYGFIPITFDYVARRRHSRSNDLTYIRLVTHSAHLIEIFVFRLAAVVCYEKYTFAFLSENAQRVHCAVYRTLAHIQRPVEVEKIYFNLFQVLHSAVHPTFLFRLLPKKTGLAPAASDSAFNILILSKGGISVRNFTFFAKKTEIFARGKRGSVESGARNDAVPVCPLGR
jgi:hypothetical protein